MWIERLSGRVPVAPVFDIAQALDSPFVRERGSVQDYAYGDASAPARLVANPIQVAGAELPRRAAPRMGEHNEALLREAGFDSTAIARLRSLGVISDA